MTKITEVIAELQRHKEEQGDIDVVNEGDEDPYFELQDAEDSETGEAVKVIVVA